MLSCTYHPGMKPCTPIRPPTQLTSRLLRALLRLQLVLDEGARALGLTVVDHLVLADGGIHSARAGLLPPPPPPDEDPA